MARGPSSLCLIGDGRPASGETFAPPGDAGAVGAVSVTKPREGDPRSPRWVSAIAASEPMSDMIPVSM
jgi:hypothetical protein